MISSLLPNGRRAFGNSDTFLEEQPIRSVALQSESSEQRLGLLLVDYAMTVVVKIVEYLCLGHAHHHLTIDSIAKRRLVVLIVFLFVAMVVVVGYTVFIRKKAELNYLVFKKGIK